MKIIIDYQQSVHAKPSSEGITVYRGKEDGKSRVVAEINGRYVWASKAEYAVRDVMGLFANGN